MSFEVRGRCETPSYFLSICEFLSFQLVRLGRLVFVRAWFAIANLCACVAIVYENEFSHIAPQTQQSSIAPPHFGLLSASAAVSRGRV